jgi:hypothetical protein
MSPFKGFSEGGESKSDDDFKNGNNAAGYGSGSDSEPVTGLQKELIAVDEVLARKMALVNGAIDEIGMTPFQWKLFFLNGFGYAVDSVKPYPSNIKYLYHVLMLAAPRRLSIHRAASRDAGVWEPKCKSRRGGSRFPGRSACWRCSLGVLCRCHWSQTGV